MLLFFFVVVSVFVCSLLSVCIKPLPFRFLRNTNGVVALPDVAMRYTVVLLPVCGRFLSFCNGPRRSSGFVSWRPYLCVLLKRVNIYL